MSARNVFYARHLYYFMFFYKIVKQEIIIRGRGINLQKIKRKSKALTSSGISVFKKEFFNVANYSLDRYFLGPKHYFFNGDSIP